MQKSKISLTFLLIVASVFYLYAASAEICNIRRPVFVLTRIEIIVLNAFLLSLVQELSNAVHILEQQSLVFRCL